jgi:integrase
LGIYFSVYKIKKTEYSPGFIKQINSSRNVFRRFIGEEKFDFASIDIPLLEKFRTYYLEELDNSKNSFAGHIKRLKFFLNYALKIGWSQNEKFREFKAPEKYGQPVCLSWEELLQLYKKDFNNKKLNQVRDIFVFQSMIGCRYSDLKMLTRENKKNNILKYVSQKTGCTIEIPLSKFALEILQRNSTFKSGPLLPVLTNQAYNRVIRTIGKKTLLNRMVEYFDKEGVKTTIPIYQLLCSHTARKNFISNAINKFNIRTEVIKSMTGHSPNSMSFACYYDIDMKTKKKAINLMN